MFGYPCPICNQRLLASPERVGQRTICPKCLKPIVIPRLNVPLPEPLDSADDIDPDEVPISLMPVADDDSVEAPSPRTPMPDLLPPKRIAASATDNSWVPIVPNYSPSDIDSGADLSSFDPEQEHFDSAPLIDLIPIPHMEHAPSAVPMATFPAMAFDEPQYVADSIPTSTPLPEVPSLPRFPQPPAAFQPMPNYFPPPAVSQTPPPMATARPAATVRSSYPTRSDAIANGMVVFNPTDVESADIAADLTAALTMRMKPPPEPPSDLRLSTGMWIILTAIAISLWLFCMMANMLDPLKYVALIAIFEILVGYFWIAYLAGHRNTMRGVTTLLPPVWICRAIEPSPFQGYRPVRFAITGLALLLLYVIGPQVQPSIYAAIGMENESPQVAKETTRTPVNRLTEAERENNTATLIDTLQLLSEQTAQQMSDAADYKVALLAKFRNHLSHSSNDVRALALRNLVNWAGDDAKPDVIKTIAAEGDVERHEAIKLASRWNDVAVAKAVAARMTVKDDYPTVSETLLLIGGTAAEEAVLPYLRSENWDVITTTHEVLKTHGGAKALAELQKTTNITARDTIRESILAIKKRLGIKGLG